jgi:anti-sigma factor RsiW
MKSDARVISDLRLEQFVLGELPEREALELRTALETDGGLRARLEEISAPMRRSCPAFRPSGWAPL